LVPAVSKELVTFIFKGSDSPSTLEDKAAHSIKMSGTAFRASHPKERLLNFECVPFVGFPI
jgi:hypothetical protein